MRRALAALALTAGLAMPAPSEAVSRCTQDSMLVFDASGSMAGMGFDLPRASRIVEARAALDATLPEIAAVRRIGLVIYGPGVGRICDRVDLVSRPEANSATAILERLDALWPAGATPITSAVRTAVAALEGQPGDVVLVTDGHETCGGAPCALAETLSRTAPGVTVHVIGFRVAGGRATPLPGAESRQGLLPATARCLADQTGGYYVLAWNTEELIHALRETLGCLIVGDPQWRHPFPARFSAPRFSALLPKARPASSAPKTR